MSSHQRQQLVNEIDKANKEQNDLVRQRAVEKEARIPARGDFYARLDEAQARIDSAKRALHDFDNEQDRANTRSHRRDNAPQNTQRTLAQVVARQSQRDEQEASTLPITRPPMRDASTVLFESRILTAFNSIPLLIDHTHPAVNTPSTYCNRDLLVTSNPIDIARYMNFFSKATAHPTGYEPQDSPASRYSQAVRSMPESGEFDPSLAIDVHNLAVKPNHCAPVVRTIFKSIDGRNRNIVEVAPDAREVTLAFYTIAFDHAFRQNCPISMLFTNAAINAVLANIKVSPPPFKSLVSVESVSRRIYYYMRAMTLTELANVEYVIFITNVRQYTGLIRLFCALIMGYGITRIIERPTPKSPDLQRDSYWPGFSQSEASGNTRMATDANVEFVPYQILPCRYHEYKRVASPYYGARIIITNDTTDTIDTQFDNINAWTTTIELNNAKGPTLERTLLIATRRCLSLRHILVLESRHITCMPMMLPTLPLKTVVDMRRCDHLVLGPTPTFQDEMASVIIAMSGPLQYNVGKKTSPIPTGAMINAASITILDIDGAAHQPVPEWFRDFTTNIIARAPNCSQFIIPELVPPSICRNKLGRNHLISYYCGIQHVRSVLTPCDNSVHRDHIHSSHMSKFQQSSGIINADIYDEEVVVPSCKRCSDLLRTLVGPAANTDFVKLFPFCAPDCTRIDQGLSVQHSCEQDVGNGTRTKPCSSCAGRVAHSNPRICITVDTEDPNSTKRLVMLVTLIRDMMATADIYVRHAPSYSAKSADRASRHSRLTALVAHLLDKKRFPRVSIVAFETDEKFRARIRFADADFAYLEAKFYSLLDKSDRPSDAELDVYYTRACVLSLIARLRDTTPTCCIHIDIICELLSSVKCISGTMSQEALYETARSNLVYLDHIGLVKFCSTANAVFPNMPHFISLCKGLMDLRTNASSYGTSYDMARVEFERMICATPMQSYELRALIDGNSAPFDIFGTESRARKVNVESMDYERNGNIGLYLNPMRLLGAPLINTYPKISRSANSYPGEQYQDVDDNDDAYGW